MMEPWDGPAAVAFTDGRQIGATLDRNGLRPARYLVTATTGSSSWRRKPASCRSRRRGSSRSGVCSPARCCWSIWKQGRIISDAEVKEHLSGLHPYGKWVERTQIVLEDMKSVEPRATRGDVSLLDRQQAFGYTQEDIGILHVRRWR